MTFTPDRKRRRSRRSARQGASGARPNGAGIGPRSVHGGTNGQQREGFPNSEPRPTTLSDQLRQSGLDLNGHALAEVFDSLDPVPTDEVGETDEIYEVDEVNDSDSGTVADDSLIESSEERAAGEEQVVTSEPTEPFSEVSDEPAGAASPTASPHPLLSDEAWSDLAKFAPEVTRSLTSLLSLDDELRAFDRPMGPDEAMHLLDGAEALSRVTEALSTLALSVYERIGTPTDSGAKDTESLIQDRLGLTGPEARRRARMAKSLGGRVSMEGQALPPLRPVMADKLHDGTLSAGQVAVIEECMQKLPSWIDPAISARAEEELVEYAKTVSVADLREIFRRMLAHIDPDGAEPKDPSDRSSYFINARPKRNGDWRVEGLLDPTAGAELHGLLTSRIESADQQSQQSSTEASDSTAGVASPPDGADALGVFDAVLTGDQHDAPPWVVVDATGREGGSANHPVPAGHGVRDDGSTVDLISEQPSARNWIYERFATLISRISMKEAAKGSPYALVVTARAEDLAKRLGEGTTGSGDRIPIDELTARGLNGTVFYHLMDEKARTVEVRTENRFANKNQIAIITARDQGCTFPGCDAPPGWCDANHVIPHSEGGKTEINNLCLACSAHHHLMDRSDWEVRMMADGRPAWIPPASRDPARRPIMHSRFIAQDIIESLFDD